MLRPFVWLSVQGLQKLEGSRLKTYLLGPEKSALRNRLQASLKQVRLLQRAARHWRCQPTPSNWQRLQHTLDRLDELSAQASSYPLSLNLGAETALPSAHLARLWEEAQHFLAPVVVTVWGVLVKLGLLMAAIAQNIPLMVGLVSTGITLYQRLATRIVQLKTEDQAQLLHLGHVLKTTFNELEKKLMFQQIHAQTENTVVAAQAAVQAAEKVEAMEKKMTQLEAENAELKKTIEKQSEKIETQSKQLKTQEEKLDQILALLAKPGSLATDDQPQVDQTA